MMSMMPVFFLPVGMLAFWSPGPIEMLLLAVVALLLYGGDLPNVARSWGKSFSEFRRSLTGIQNDINEVIYSEPERLEYHQETSSPYVASPETMDAETMDAESIDAEAIDAEANGTEAIDTGVTDTEVHEVEITDTEMSDAEVLNTKMTLTEVSHRYQDSSETEEEVDIPAGPSEVDLPTDAESTATPPSGHQPPASAS